MITPSPHNHPQGLEKVTPILLTLGAERNLDAVSLLAQLYY